MTLEEYIEYLNENKDKIFEISFGNYWLQMPFGLIKDIFIQTLEYSIEEKKNDITN